MSSITYQSSLYAGAHPMVGWLFNRGALGTSNIVQSANLVWRGIIFSVAVCIIANRQILFYFYFISHRRTLAKRQEVCLLRPSNAKATNVYCFITICNFVICLPHCFIQISPLHSNITGRRSQQVASNLFQLTHLLTIST